MGHLGCLGGRGTPHGTVPNVSVCFFPDRPSHKKSSLMPTTKLGRPSCLKYFQCPSRLYCETNAKVESNTHWYDSILYTNAGAVSGSYNCILITWILWCTIMVSLRLLVCMRNRIEDACFFVLAPRFGLFSSFLLSHQLCHFCVIIACKLGLQATLETTPLVRYSM